MGCVRPGWETHLDVSSIAAAGNKKDGRVAGAASVPPPTFHTSYKPECLNKPVWFEILFYLNSLPMTRIL